MGRTNLTVSVTVFLITDKTYVPHGVALPEGVTHFVDLIELSRGEVMLGTQIYLSGTHHPDQDKFYFSEEAKGKLSESLNTSFANPVEVLRFLEEIVNFHIRLGL